MTKPILTKDAKPASDINAHTARIDSYANYATRDINSILDEELAGFSNDAALSILDIGCGNGKQSLYLARKFPKAKITAIDISKDAINQLQEKNPEINSIICDLNDMDTFQGIVKNSGSEFDIIISFYALYYVTDIETVLPVLKKSLKTNGRLVLTGFSQHNNKELLEITRNYVNQTIETDDFIPSWMIEKYFGNHVFKSYYFQNPLRFPSIGPFLEYYRNYGLYLKDIETSVANEVQKEIINAGVFILSKVALVVSVTGQEDNHGMTALPSPLKTDVFSLKRYTELLGRFIESGYAVLRIGDLQSAIDNQQGRFLLLRHDVDLAPYCACKMAEIEAQVGIKSTYYFLVGGGFFNILEKECRNCLTEISAMGHEIGLHFDDPSTIRQDCEILFALTGKKVLSLSQHNPTINGLKTIQETSLINAYDKTILDKHGFVYVSDSGMKWRGKDIFNYLDCPRLYFLAHPETWWSEGCDLVQLHRIVQQHEMNKLTKIYNGYVAGNIDYLKKRMVTDGR
jgi:ubiquinone/menaquinone biosynthesis C-methylase UbiE